MTEFQAYTAFAGTRRIASGRLCDVAVEAKAESTSAEPKPLLVFDNVTGRVVDLDFRGTVAEVLARLAAPEVADTPMPGRGRPRLGVVAREVTLLPRHWDWLNAQPGGASVALRRLVEVARKDGEGSEDRRRAQEAAYRFASAIAGDAAGYEEAMRALYAGDPVRFAQSISSWPADIRDHASALAAASFAKSDAT